MTQPADPPAASPSGFPSGGSRTEAGGDAVVLIDLLYFEGCPHHDELLPHLRQLLSDNDIQATITLVEVRSDEDAQRLRFLGSPTVRVDGHDIEAGAEDRRNYGVQCRVYQTTAGVSGLPRDEWILDALPRAPPA